jgi:fibronectin type 3 domain-containing protein
LDSIAFFVIFTLTALAGSSILWSQTYPTQIGAESSDRPTGFIDAFKDQGRLFQDNSGNPVPTDASGNPLSDGIAVIFDDRPTPAWAPPIDDPAQYQPNMSGTYTMSFTGEATLSSVAGNPTLMFSNQTYNPDTNTTTVSVYLPGGATYADGPALMVISFTNTVLNSGGGTNTGIANLQVIRPGFTLAEAANSTQVFDPLFVSAFGPFSYIRFMGWLGTNQNPFVVSGCASTAPACNSVGTPTTGWSQRSLPTDIYQGVGPSIASTYPGRSGAWGMSWEYVILLANATNKDVWINIPINATGSPDQNDPAYVASPDTSSYVYNLAQLFKNGDAFTGNKGLNPGLHIYLENSNEVWNWGFMQSSWNVGAAEAEVAAAPGGVSVLNNDGNTSNLTWAYRRHLKRVYEIAQIFESVYGAGSFGTIIRPVYAWWQLDEGSGSNAAAALTWFNANYGPPANYFYGMAQGDYFTASNYANDTTIPDVLSDMSSSSTASVSYVTANLATANQYGLRLMVYEGGPDNSNGGLQNTVNVGPQILANRDPGMDTLVQTHIRNNYFGQGGSTFGYFALSGAYSRYGDYGATDDYRSLTTAKYNAIVNLTGYEPNGLPFSPGDLLATGGNTAVSLSWLTVPGATSYNVLRGTASGGETLLTSVSSSASSYSDSTVSNGVTYYYVITGTNSTGTGAPSNEASAIPEALAPSAPALTATAGNAQAALTWTAPAGATSYNIYQGSTSGGESTTPIATGVTLTSYTVQSLSNGTTYYFEVAAVNSLGTGAISIEASVTPTGPPAAPTGLTATIGDGQVVLAWAAVSGAASYNVYQGTASGGESSTPVATGVTAATYTVTGLTDGTEYFFTVAAVNGAGASGSSNEAAVAPAPPSALLAYEPFGEAGTTPFALYGASGGGDSGWGAAWDEQSGSTVVPGYNIASTTPLTYTGLLTTPDYAIGGYGYQSAGRELDVSSIGPFSSYLSSGAIGAPGQTIWLSFLFRVDASNIDTGAVFLNTSNTDWYYSASNNLGIGYFGGSSNDASGNPWWSLQFNGTTVQSTAPMVVGQPALLVIEDTFGASGQPDQINLFVNPISLGGAAPTTSTLQYSPANSTAFQGIAYYGGNNTNMSSLADIRLGATFAAVTPVPTVAAPAAPTGLTVTAGNGQAALSWTASTGATSYNVYEGTASGGEGTTPIVTGITGASYMATGLTNGTTYYFTVAAVNTNGVSAASNEASATPLGPIVIPAAPTSLTATAGSGQVALSWTASTGAVSYNVYQGTASGAEGTTPVATGVTATTYTVTGLTGGTAYFFTAAAVNAAGTSGPSNEASATPAIGYGAGVSITVPNYSFELDNQSNYIAPQDWTHTTAGTSNVVNQVCNQACNSSLTGITGTYFWNPSVQNNGSAPFGTGTSTLTTTSSLGTFAANTQYMLTVALAANNPSTSSVGFEVLGNGVPVATFVAPTTGGNALSSTALQDYSVTFTTVGNSSVVGQNITLALVYTYTGQYGKAAQFDNVRLTQALETGLPPLAPTGLTATAGSAQVALSWTAVSGAASYNVYQGTTSGGESSTPVATGITATTYTVTGLTDGTGYFFTVAAVNGAGVSDVSNEATAIPQFVYGSATPITVPNYSFELGDGSGNNSGYIYPVDWNFTSSGTDGGSGTQYVADNATAGTPLTGVTGSYYWAPGANDNGSLPYGSSTATLTSASSLGTFAADTLYSLTVALGASGNSDLSNFQVGFQLLANGVPVANFVAPTSGANALPPGCNCPGTGLADYSLTFSTAGLSQYVGENITVALVYTFTGQYGRSAYFDNVRLTQAQAELPPTAPTGLTAISGNGQAALSWTASTGATSYNVYEGTASGGEGTTPIATGITGASYTATGLTIGTTYYFTVAAVNTSGVSAASNEASAMPLASPAAPTGLTATAGNGQVALSWTATAGATSYNVYEGTASGAESTTPVASGVTATTYTVTGLTGGTAYFFTVAAVNTAGTSAYSNEATATLSVLSSGTLLAYEPFEEAGTTPFALNGASGGGDSGWIAAWDVQGGNASVPGYNIASASPLTYTGLVTTPDYAVGGSSYLSSGRALDVTSTGPFSSYLSSGLIGAPGQTIWLSFLLRQDVSGQSPNVGLTAQGGGNSFWINPANIEVGYFGGSSNDSGGNPWWSLQYNGTTIQTNAPVVTGQAALFVVEDTFGSNGQPDQINLFVNPISLSGAAPATPTLQYSPANSTAFQSIAYYGGDNTNMSSLGDIRLGTSYAAVTPALPVVIPPSPASLTATPGNGLANLTWTPVTGATSYNVYQGTASGGESATPVATGVTAGNYTVTGLTNNTTYYFEVAAMNAAGTGAFSSEASVTPSVVAGIPAAPLLAAAAGDQTATLSWNAVPGASTYNVYEATTSGGEGTTPVVTGITGTTYTVSGLTDETTYFFQVSTTNSSGTSALSNQASATPAPAVAGTNAPAVFSIYPQVVAAHPVPAGFSIAPAAGGGQIGENAWLSDGGFNALDNRLSLTADTTGTATTFIDQNNSGGTSFWQSIASGFFVGATARTYRYTGGAWTLLRTDTVTGYTAPVGTDTPTAANSTVTFAASGPATEAGDIIWLDLDDQPVIPNVNTLNTRFTTYDPSWQTETQNGQSRSATWPVTLSTNVPASDPGGLSAVITDTNTETQGIWQYIQSAFVGPEDEEFQPGHTYEFDVWLMQSGIASGSVTVEITGLSGISHTFTGVNGTWQEFTWTFAAPAGLAAGASQPTVRLDYSAPGTLYVDNFQLYDTAWAPNTVSPQVMTAWQNYQPGTVRIWSNFSNSGGGYSFWGLDSWLTPEIKSHNTTGIGNQYTVSVQLEHLPDALANVKAIGTANPWLIVNMALSEVEWGELIEYLAAPAGTGYASMRPANHPGPYTADFSTIYLEVGNEEWGTQSVPADTAYGQWAHFVITQATAGKSYFNSSQIKFIVNGFVLEPGFGSAAIAAAPEASYTEAALYSNGNTALSGDPYYQSDLVQVPVTNGPQINAIVAQQQLDAASGRVYGLAAYEEGPGNSTTPGDNTLAAAIGAIDVNLYASQSGFGPQNFFLYNLGTGPWSSHNNFANGFRPHPIWEALQMRNNYCSGPIVLTTTNSVPTYSDPAITNGQPVPLIAVYTFQDAHVVNQADVVVISRDLNNDTPVTLNFPATPTGTANLYTLTGDPRATNTDAMNIPIGSTTVNVTANYTFTMPPGSMYIFQVPMTGAWSSTGVPTPPTPVSLSASAGNGEVTLTWAASEGATGYTVLRGATTGGPYTQIGTSTSVAYTDTAVTNGTTYYYVVEATNSGGASAYSPEASATPNVEDDSSTATPPPLDGSNTGAWANAPFIPLTHYFSAEASTNGSPDTAAYKTLWDSNYLYVLVSVQDPYLIAPTAANIWTGSTVEVYFSGTDTKSTTYGPTDFQYAFPYGFPAGGAVVTEADHSPASLTGVLFGQQNITGGYQMAMALPWTTLGTVPVLNQQYGFDVIIDDASVQGTRIGKLAWWATCDCTWDNPSLMGPLVLIPSTPQPQTITFNDSLPSSAPYSTGLSYTISATGGGSGNPVTFQVSGPATLTGSTLNITGVGTVTITANQAGNTNYLAAPQVTQSMVINQATPAIIWATPAAITYGTALSATQLDATASVAGSFVYTPVAGTTPPVGNDTLSVTFTPTDATDYTTATATVTLTVNSAVNPAPVINSMSPAFTSANSTAFTLTVNGSGFTANSTVYWGASALITTYGNATQLMAQVTAADIATAGITAITVQTPTPGGGTSSALQFEVDSAGSGTVTFTTVTATVTPGSTATYPVILPSDARNVTVMCLNLPPGAACSYSATTKAVTITTSSTTPAGTYQITVVFTETVPGAATGVILLPILLLPLVFLRRKMAARGVWVTACLGLILLAGAAAACVGCGGSAATHKVTSSGVVSLTVQ